MEQGVGKAFGKYVAFNVMGALGLSCYILADTYFVAAGAGAEDVYKRQICSCLKTPLSAQSGADFL